MRKAVVKKKGAVRGRRRATSVRRVRSFDWLTVLSLLLVFPYGITRMWRARCRWANAVKYAISGTFIVLAVASVSVLLLNTQPARGGVELCGSDANLEIFGPELPEAFVKGYTRNTAQSGVLSTTEIEEEDGDSSYVYAAEDAKCYHTWKCRFAFASSKRITPYEAYFLGYKPCNICNPPVYDASTGTTLSSEAAAVQN